MPGGIERLIEDAAARSRLWERVRCTFSAPRLRANCARTPTST